MRDGQLTLGARLINNTSLVGSGYVALYMLHGVYYEREYFVKYLASKSWMSISQSAADTN